MTTAIVNVAEFDTSGSTPSFLQVLTGRIYVEDGQFDFEYRDSDNAFNTSARVSNNSDILDIGRSLTVSGFDVFDVSYSNGSSIGYFVFQDTTAQREYLIRYDVTGSNALPFPTSQALFNATSQNISSFGKEPFIVSSGAASVALDSFDAIRVTDDDLLFRTFAPTDDTFSFGAGDDILYSGAARDTVSGGDGNDRLVAVGDGIDVVDRANFSGDAGNDVLKAKNGTLAIFDGGPGNDKLVGSSNGDTLNGGSGADVLIGLAGEDTLSGGSGDDDLFGGRDADMLFGDAGVDRLNGNLGNDTLFGGSGDDILRGGGSNDILDGQSDNDFLLGGRGKDTLRGGAGDDTLVGGEGGSTFDGARDLFEFHRFDGTDRIKDFEDGIDQILIRRFGLSDFETDLLPLVSERASGLRIEFDTGDLLFVLGMTLEQFDASDVLLLPN